MAFFCTDPSASVGDILEAVADRGAIEQTFKDVKEVWGAGQQQLRNIDANVGAFNLNCWMHSVTEAWAWQQPEETLGDRRRSPWDDAARRPSHADKRKALQREVLRQEIQAALAGRPNKQRFRDLAERLMDLASMRQIKSRKVQLQKSTASYQDTLSTGKRRVSLPRTLSLPGPLDEK